MSLETHIWIDLDNDSVDLRESIMDEEGEFFNGESLLQRKGKDDIIATLSGVREHGKKGHQIPSTVMVDLSGALYRLYDSHVPKILSHCLEKGGGGGGEGGGGGVRMEFPYDKYVKDCPMIIQPFLLVFLGTKMLGWYLQWWMDVKQKKGEGGVVKVVYDLSGANLGGGGGMLGGEGEVGEEDKWGLRKIQNSTAKVTRLTAAPGPYQPQKDDLGVLIYGIVQEDYVAKSIDEVCCCCVRIILKLFIFLFLIYLFIFSLQKAFVEINDAVIVLKELNQQVRVRTDTKEGLIPKSHVRVVSKDTAPRKFDKLSIPLLEGFPSFLLTSRASIPKYSDLLHAPSPPFISIYFAPHPLLDWLPVVVSRTHRTMDFSPQETLLSLRRRICVGLCKLVPQMTEVTGYFELLFQSFGLKRNQGAFLLDEKAVKEVVKEEGGARCELRFEVVPYMLEGEVGEKAEILSGLVESERQYISSLLALGLYKKGLMVLVEEGKTSQGHITKTDVQKMFSNLESLFTVHIRFWEHLGEKMKGWVARKSTVGDILNSHVSLFMLYVEWVSRSKNSLDFFNNNIKNREDLELHIPFRPKCDITTLFSIPCERVAQYLDVLGPLCQLTPNSHPDSELLTKALGALKTLCGRIDECVGRTKQVKREKGWGGIIIGEKKGQGENFLLHSFVHSFILFLLLGHGTPPNTTQGDC